MTMQKESLLTTTSFARFALYDMQVASELVWTLLDIGKESGFIE
jgi:hypothetical protein